MRGADPALLRQINAAHTLRVLFHGGRMTLTQLVDATGLARKTAEAAVEQLAARLLVADVPPPTGDRRVGRPARAFRFRPEAGHVLGLEIGARRVTAIVADLHGTIQARYQQPVPRTAGRAQRLQAAVAAAQRCAAEARVELENLWATTVGTPGLVEDASRVTLCHVLPEWSEFSLADELAEAFAAELPGELPGPVAVENDTNLSAMAEHWRGAATDVDHMVWVLTGRRFSASILIDGELYRGADGAAGEIGWLPELGWSEASEQTLSFIGADHTAVGESAAGTISRAVAGDDAARRELDTFARAVAPGFTALALAFNPRCLVVGGGIASAGETLLAALAEHMRPHCLRLPQLRMSALGGESVALGAVRLSLDEVERGLFALAL